MKKDLWMRLTVNISNKSSWHTFVHILCVNLSAFQRKFLKVIFEFFGSNQLVNRDVHQNVLYHFIKKRYLIQFNSYHNTHIGVQYPAITREIFPEDNTIGCHTSKYNDFSNKWCEILISSSLPILLNQIDGVHSEFYY